MSDERKQLKRCIRVSVDELRKESVNGDIKFLAVITTHSDGQAKRRLQGFDDPAEILAVLESAKVDVVLDACFEGRNNAPDDQL